MRCQTQKFFSVKWLTAKLSYLKNKKKWEQCSKMIRSRMDEACLMSVVTELLGIYQFDAVLTMSHPFSSHLKFLEIRRSLNISLPWYVVVLDPHADNSGITERKARKEAIWAENEVFSACTKICAVPEFIQFAQMSPISNYMGKTVEIIDNVIAPFQYKSDSDSANRWLVDGKINLVFSGRVFETIRPVTPLLKLADSMPEHFAVHLFATGCTTSRDKIAHYCDSHTNVINHGFVSNDEINRIYLNADILINLGNIVHQVPGKLFTYITTGKPILHISQSEKDISPRYLEEYPYACIVDANAIDVDKIIQFCESHRGKWLSYAQATTHLEKYKLENIIDRVVEN